MRQINITNDKILVFGGVYSNLQALVAIKQIAEERGYTPNNVICTGDIVAYCAQPVECVELMQAWGIHCISGNVEQQIVAGLDDCACDFTEGGRCDLFSKQWYPYTKSKMNASNIEYMETLPQFITFNFCNKK